MKFHLPSPKQNRHSSVIWHESATISGVRYATRRTSLAQRIELTARVRELTSRHEFLRAGEMVEQLDAALAELLTRRLYLEWGLAEVKNLLIDGEPTTVELLIEKGPEELSAEIAASIQGQLSLSEEERKNS